MSGVESLWVGALAADGATVAAKVATDSSALRLAVTGPSGVSYTSPVASSGRLVKLAVSGLSPDTEYTYQVEDTGAALAGAAGRFRTLPAPGAASFTVALSGDAEVRSNHRVFDRIREAVPLMFLHLGDAHYTDISSGSAVEYEHAYDLMFLQPRQAHLYREVPTMYVWDDHDYGPNDSDGTYSGRSTACQKYRERVPHYPLADASSTAPIYHSFVIGRVRFVVTDQRSAASAKSATDNSSKSMLGAAQKTWFKAELSAAAAAGQMVAWVCPRTWGGVATAGADHWGGFTTERRELADYIHANCPGRVIVLSADRHAVSIDDGSHHTFGTGATEPLKTFQASPLDRNPDNAYGGATYSEGSFANNGQYGTMQVTDSGGPAIGITWRGFNSAGTQIVSYSFSVSV